MPGINFLRILTAVLPFVALAFVMWRTWRLLPFALWGNAVVLAAMLLLTVLMPVCMLPGTLDKLPLPLAVVLYKASLSWVFVLLYMLVCFLLVDLLGLAHIVPQSLRFNSLVGTLGLVAVLAVVFVAGNINYHHKHREEISLHAAKPLAKPLKIVMLSDLHTGYHIRRAELSQWVDIINGEKPDLVLIAGDVIDRSVEPLRKDRDAAEFRRIKAPVYACPGNHEYYSDIDKACRFFRMAGITMLRDSAVSVAGINIVGRDDLTNRRRKPLAELVSGIDSTRFTILLDHQPVHLDDAHKCGVDFELCGHTHNGQLWPVSWITRAMYECAYGHCSKGRTQYYVTSGIGIWGGKFRIGTRSEYVVMNLE
jgi:uncharacterized protein